MRITTIVLALVLGLVLVPPALGQDAVEPVQLFGEGVTVVEVVMPGPVISWVHARVRQLQEQIASIDMQMLQLERQIAQAQQLLNELGGRAFRLQGGLEELQEVQERIKTADRAVEEPLPESPIAPVGPLPAEEDKETTL